MMASYLVTGSSRGIGLGLVTHLISLPAGRVRIVFATVRNAKNSAALVSLANSPEGRGRIMLVTLDTCDKSSVDQAAATVQSALGPESGLDVLINNAGILSGRQGITELTDDELMRNLQTNALGVHRVMRAFLPLMRKGTQKKIVNLGATLSSMSISTKTAEKSSLLLVSGYAISKTALNMISVQWAMTLKDEGFIIAVVCPGWIQSDMGGPRATLLVKDGCEAIMEKIDSLDQSHNGKFLRTAVTGMEVSSQTQNDDNEIPW